MADNQPKFLIQYERRLPAESGLRRILMSNSNWVTVDTSKTKPEAIEKAQKLKGHVRVIEKYHR